MVFGHKLHEEESVNILELIGELVDKGQAKSLIEETEALLSLGHKRLVFDMKNLKYLNSSGLGVLIGLLTKARKNGGEVILFDIATKVQELLLITKLNTVFVIAANKAEAISIAKNQ